MESTDRRNAIVDMLKQNRFIKATDFVKMFNVSGETIRRDLEYLQSQDIVKRVYGGAVLSVEDNKIIGKVHRPHQDDMDAIGKAAADLILPGETVFLDCGMTVSSIARHLKGRSDITVVTSSLPVISELADSDLTLITVGGIISSTDGDIHGDLAIECAKYFYCNKAFFSCSGFTPELGIMDYCSSYMTLHRQFYKRSDKYILVADSSKFGKTSTMFICPTSNLDMIITDSGISEIYRQQLAEQNVELLIADSSTKEIHYPECN